MGIHRIVDRSDEAITSEAYTGNIRAFLGRIYESAFWVSKARFEQVRQRLNDIALLAHGSLPYGAEEPNEVARNVAHEVLSSLEAASLPPASVIPLVDGGIEIVFVDDTNRAVIDIYNSGEIVAAAYQDQGEPTVWEIDDIENQLQGTIAHIRVHLAA